MLTNKNLRAAGAGSSLPWLFAVCLLLVVMGCTPPGPRALIEGRKLMDEGKWAEAIPRLQEATELLGTNAVAWSSLGLAYHQNGQLEQSFKAYQMALKLDHTMATVRFNLGCLYLDMDNLSAALEELRAFTLVQPAAVDGWVKLGTAQYRARRFDEAERSYKTALGLQSRHPEALNGQGLVQVQRRRWQEAVSLFSLASAQDTNYAPALLNAAVVHHQYLNNRPLALAQYRRYLELVPSAGGEVRTAIAQLERELSPAPAVAAASPASTRPQAATSSSRSNAVVQTQPGSPERRGSETRTAAAAAAPAGSSSAVSAGAGSTARSTVGGTRTAEPAPSTRPAVASSTPAAGAGAASPASTSSSSTSAPTAPAGGGAARAVSPAVTTTSTGPGATGGVATSVRPVEKPPELEVARVRDDLVVRPPQETGNSAGTAVSPARGAGAGAVPTNVASAGTAAAGASVEATPPPPKRGFFSRLNPFSRATRTNGEPEAAASGASGAGGRELVRPDGLPDLAPPSIVRYAYVSPKRPGDGNRAEATEAFKRGIKAQKGGDRAGAVTEYQAAIRADPGFFEAYYNLGLVAMDTGDARLSLWAYEYALTIRNDSLDARYNLALALKAGGYALDSADQLEILLQENPKDARAHLSLANLCAQQLKQPRRAREHYLRVLELQPRHPEAATIRYWLAANP